MTTATGSTTGSTTGPRHTGRTFLSGLAISAASMALAFPSMALAVPSAAWADEREPMDPAPSVPLVATTSTTVFPSAPSSPVSGLLAGTVAGEGRGHPGRTEISPSATAPSSSPFSSPSTPAGAAPGGRSGGAGPGAVPGGEEAGRHRVAPPSYAPRGAAHAPGRREAAGEPDRVMRVLPLGTGMTLTGLGLGFIALRLRRR
ncbi:hypothetical protein [Streptomyces sp. NPDC001678]|uniref:hypothetical protein n=1 Tax=Streptomyces sp. NPDC001678 TaxID=3364599 RepID=UPI0036BFDBF7